MNHTEASYRAEWAVKTGRNPSDIYVPRDIAPEALPPLDAGDRIRILQDNHDYARVLAGDILAVTSRVSPSGRFTTNSPRLLHNAGWTFELANEGIGWERVR